MQGLIQRWFPLSNDRTIGLYYLYSALYGLYPVNAIVGLFFVFKGLTYAEIGVVFTVFALAGFLFEVPTGYLADRYGRRLSILIGLTTLSLTALLWTFADTYIHFALLAAVWMIGFTCISGSFEAYMYDHLVDIGATEQYDAVLSKTAMLWYYTGAVGAVLGGFLFSVDAAYPYLLLSGLFALAALVVLRMDADGRPQKSTEAPLSLTVGVRHIWSHPSLLWLTCFVASFWGYHEFFISSVNSPYIVSLQVFDIAYLGVFMAVSSLAKGYISAHFVSLRRSLSDTALVTLLSLIQVGTLLGMGLTTGLWGLACIFVFMQLYAFEQIIMNSFSQKYIPSESRATTLSTMNVASAIVASAVGLGTGLLVDSIGLSGSFVWVAVGMALALTTLLSIRSYYRIQL